MKCACRYFGPGRGGIPSLEDVLNFATEVGPERLITITAPRNAFYVWYWEDDAPSKTKELKDD